MASSLPADPNKEGNVWCEACQRSLVASRAGTHLASKAHLAATGLLDDDESPAAAPAKPAKASKTAGGAGATATTRRAKKPAKVEDDPDDEEPEVPAPEKKKVEKKPPTAEKKEAQPKGAAAAKGHGLPRDPNKEGNFWCGICEVSLTPAKANGHRDTQRHQQNERQTVANAMGNLRLDNR